MAFFSAAHQLRATIGGPVVALAYATIATLVVKTGCRPPFTDVEFFGVPVTTFFLAALTASALVLILFAGWNAWRVARIARRRTRPDDAAHRQALGLTGAVLSVLAFGGTAWLA